MTPSLHRPARSDRSVFRALVVTAATALTASAQSATITPQPGQELHPVWGGAVTAVHTLQADGGFRTLIGADGGRIRFSPTGGSLDTDWQYADTPDDFTGTVLDFDFLNDDHGFACARGGRILETTNGGLNWTYFGVPVTDPCGDPATLWGIDALNTKAMFAIGLWTASYTVDGGANWLSLELYPEGSGYTGPTLLQDNFHFYSIDVVHGPTGFRGAIAAQWEAGPNDDRGVVFHTDFADPAAGRGTKWVVTLDDIEYRLVNGVPSTEPEMTEPWEVDFERGSVATSARGYVVGAPLAGTSGSGGGVIYQTDDGGASWHSPQYTGAGCFGVTSENAGGVHRAVVAGYSGRAFWLDSTGVFQQTILPTASTVFTPGQNLAALAAADSSGPDHYVVGGGFGSHQQTFSYPPIWEEGSPFYELDVEEFRLSGVHTVEPSSGPPTTAYVCGQLGMIMKTQDRGRIWEVQRHIAAGAPNSSAGEYMEEIEFWDDQVGVAVGSNDVITRTTDGGTTWNNVLIIHLFNQPSNIHFKDVSVSPGGNGWAVGNQGSSPAVCYTQNFGATWYQVAAPTLGGLQLEGVSFPDVNEGLLVGWTPMAGGGSRARAFQGVVSLPGIPATVSWIARHPLHDPTTIPPHNPSSTLPDLQPTRKFLSIDSRGPSLDLGETYAVGNDGMVLRWDPVANSFVNVPGVFEVNLVMGVPKIQVQMTTADLRSIGMSEGSAHILVGSEYDIETAKSDDLGWALRHDGTGWSRIRQHSGKCLQSISLADSGEGFVCGQVTGDHLQPGVRQSFPDSCDFTSSEHRVASFNSGNLADSILLRYEP